MKKLITIVVLGLLFFSQAGYYAALEIMKEIHKEQYIARISPLLKDHELIKIDVANKNIVWEEEGKEFTMNGILYDVVRKITINEKTFFLCLDDSRETHIVTTQNAVSKNNSDSDKDSKTNKSFKIVSDYECTEMSTVTEVHSISQNNFSFSYNEGLVKPGFTGIQVPPPRC